MPITIEVTEEDIKNGEPYNSHKCPLALACKRAVGKDWMEVYLQYYRPSGIPENIKVFIRYFDFGKEVKPFSFVLPEKIGWKFIFWERKRSKMKSQKEAAEEVKENAKLIFDAYSRFS